MRHARKHVAQHVGLGQRTRVVGRVAPDLAQRPRGGSLDVVFRLGRKRVAQRGDALRTLFDGNRPDGYSPMHKQGAIVLGIGGDNSDFGVGTFYEGAMTANYTSDATDAAVHANIAAAGYGK